MQQQQFYTADLSIPKAPLADQAMNHTTIITDAIIKTLTDSGLVLVPRYIVNSEHNEWSLDGQMDGSSEFRLINYSNVPIPIVHSHYKEHVLPTYMLADNFPSTRNPTKHIQRVTINANRMQEQCVTDGFIPKYFSLKVTSRPKTSPRNSIDLRAPPVDTSIWAGVNHTYTTLLQIGV